MGSPVSVGEEWGSQEMLLPRILNFCTVAILMRHLTRNPKGFASLCKVLGYVQTLRFHDTLREFEHWHPGQCICNYGWGGAGCQRQAVYSQLKTCPNDCSANGLCMDGICACNVGFKGADCSDILCSGGPTLCSGCKAILVPKGLQ